MPEIEFNYDVNAKTKLVCLNPGDTFVFERPQQEYDWEAEQIFVLLRLGQSISSANFTYKISSDMRFIADIKTGEVYVKDKNLDVVRVDSVLQCNVPRML